ncbi:MAG: ERAP1-like C-terminal domain-containing protein, partial [Actinomycetota bacterium]|nr:ERAP1-like C-terminal domain-containing protein [Actinomycetota bacterium]
LSARALDVLSEAERYGLVDDTWSAVLAGELEAGEHIALVTSLASETDLAVWQRILSSLEHLHSIADDAGRRRMTVLIRDLSTTGLGVLGFEPIEGEPDLDRELRGALFAAAGTTGRDTSVREIAKNLFGQATTGTAVEPNLAAAVVRVAAAAGDDTTHAHLVKLYSEAPTPQLELRYLVALLELEDVALFKKTLALITSEVRSQNAPYLLSAAMTHRRHGLLAWELVRDRWDKLNAKFPQNSIPRMVAGIRALSTPSVAAEIRSFFENHPIPQGHLTLQQHLEKLEVNVALRLREGHRLGD